MSEVITSISPATPTITEMDRAAELCSAAIEAVAALIPGLEIPHPLTRGQVRAQRTVPREFIESMIAAVEQVESLRALGKFDAEDAREALQFQDAFGPIADLLAHLTAPLKFTLEWRKARAAAGALQTYGIGRELARDEKVTPLTAHNEFLERDLRRAQKSGRGARAAGSPTCPDGSDDPSHTSDLHRHQAHSASETIEQTPDQREDPGHSQRSLRPSINSPTDRLVVEETIDDRARTSGTNERHMERHREAGTGPVDYWQWYDNSAWNNGGPGFESAFDTMNEHGVRRDRRGDLA